MALLIQEDLSVEAERVFSDMACIRCFKQRIKQPVYSFSKFFISVCTEKTLGTYLKNTIKYISD